MKVINYLTQACVALSLVFMFTGCAHKPSTHFSSDETPRVDFVIHSRLEADEVIQEILHDYIIEEVVAQLAEKGYVRHWGEVNKLNRLVKGDADITVTVAHFDAKGFMVGYWGYAADRYLGVEIREARSGRPLAVIAVRGTDYTHHKMSEAEVRGLITKIMSEMPAAGERFRPSGRSG